MNSRYIFLGILLSIGIILQAQPGLKVYKDASLDGYAMFETTEKTYLINNCGEVVNSWNVNFTELHTKLLPDGNMIYIRNSVVYIRDWEDNLVEFVTHPPTANIVLKYEVIELPNKNLLCVARQYYTDSDFENIGYTIDAGESPYQMDAVVELDRNTGDIVWMWSLGDHVIQQRDENAPNYGILADNPQLLNMDAVYTYDWTFEESFMINGMDYNAELDQIALSVRKIGEVVIIDHSTTTEEAAGSTGGNSGMGGDILYRWGNPQNYDHGTDEDRSLYFHHNPNWIHYGEHKGKLIMFNNGLTRSPGFSEGIIIDTPYNPASGQYEREEGQQFAPAEPAATYSEYTTDHTNFYSEYTSAAKVLPNGNILLTEGDDSEMTELTPDGEIVWQYNIPEDWYIFRGEKYAKDYPGFEGKDLSGEGTIENPPSEVPCEILSDVEPIIEEHIDVKYSSSRLIEIYNPNAVHYAYRVADMQGRQLLRGRSIEKYQVVDLRDYSHGIAVLSLIDITTGKLLTTKQLVF